MKKKYVKSEMEIIEFDVEDVIATSGEKNRETLEEAYEDDGEGNDLF